MRGSAALANSRTTATYSLARDLRRFIVEALCLLMLFYGAPLQALEETVEPVSFSEESGVDSSGIASTVVEWVEPVVSGAQASAVAIQQGVGEMTSQIVHQPWGDALALMLTASSLGLTQTPRAPPSPPADPDRPSKDYDLESLAAGFPEASGAEKSALDAVPLLPGWNQVSLPEVPGTADPASVLAAIGGSFHKVYAYDSCDAADPWKVYDPNDATNSDLAAITVEQGLLIDASAAVSLPSDGTLPDSTTLTLCTGWNLIGFPSAHPRHVRNALAPILDNVVRVFAFDPFDLADNWKFHEASAPAWASDLDIMEPGKGYWVLVSEDVSLDIKNVGDAPTIAFTSPQDLDVITAPTEIQGTVASDLLDNWQLRYRGVGESDWIELATGNFPVDGRLGDFDPTLLLNGMYELELIATDLQGLQVTDSIAIVVEGNMKIGHFTLSFVDLAIPLSGLDIEVVRTYDSRQRHLQGDFGYGWSLDIRQGSYRNNRPPGDGWQIRATEGPWGLPCSPNAVLETKSHLTTVRLSDQEVYQFRLTVKDPGTIIGGCIGRAEFEYVDGPVPGATLEILGNDDVLYQNNSFELRDPNTFALYVPEDVKLTTRDGRIFHLDLNDGVTHLEDLNGNTLDITPEGITHSSGRGVEFVRDAEGRIARIIDPMGNANVYAYDAAGDHVTFTDRVGAETRFAYTDGHYLEDIVNALGVRAVRTEYDDDGRMVRMIDAAGKVTSFEHDLDNRREVVTDRLGFIRVLEYDGRGNVVREVDAAGAVTSRSYDQKDRLLSAIDPLQRRTTYTYSTAGDLVRLTDPAEQTLAMTYDDMGFLTTLADPLGNTTGYGISDRSLLVSVRDALGQTTTLSHNDHGELIQVVDAAGGATHLSYDDDGRLVGHTDAEGNSTSFTVDSLGNRVREQRQRTLFDGTTEELVREVQRDALGRPVRVMEADGSVTETAYDALGNVISLTDPAGRLTRFEHTEAGRLDRVIDAQQGIESYVYDAEGRLITSTDRAGRSTTLVRDPVGRVIEVHQPDGSIDRQTFDAAGQLQSTTDGTGRTTTFSYDAAGRRTEVIDPFGLKTAFGYNGAGWLTSLTDAAGQTTTFSHDALGRRVQTRLANGERFSSTLDAVGRVTQETDPEGHATRFDFDRLGRLQRVVDALGHETTFDYDEVGNLVRQTDALGRVSRYAYDAVGRRTSRVLPDGASETWTYGIDGLPARHVDFNGNLHTLEYDDLGRLVQRAVGSAVVATYSYDAAGRRVAATDARGTARWSYDAMDRLVEKEEPDGRKLRFAYDASGRTTRVEAHRGVDVYRASITYDGRGLPSQATDPSGGVYTFSHDAAGRPLETQFPNGVATFRSYDLLGQLIELRTENATGQALFQESYQYSLSGRRILTTELDGTQHAYTFDPIGRLVDERSTDAEGLPLLRSTWTYDGVGNRVTASTQRSDGPPDEVAASYDVRNRLLQVGGIPRTWDANGNLLSDGSTSYTWDVDNRLQRATLADGSVLDFETDIDGQRVGMTLRRGEAEEVHRWWLDDHGLLSHVVLEEKDGDLAAVNSRLGSQLLARNLPGGSTHYAHGDVLGSIRVLTDSLGEATDRYRYAAFGELTDRSGSSLNPYRFAGERWNAETGLYHLRARDLDIGSGTFIGLDPFEGEPFTPASLHGYHYASLDPVNNLDPTGRFTVSSQTVANLSYAALQGVAFGGISYVFSRARGLPHEVAFKRALGAGGIGVLLTVPYLGPALGIYFIGGFLWAAYNGELGALDYWEFATFLVAALVLKQVHGGLLRSIKPAETEPPPRLPGQTAAQEPPQVFRAVENGVALPEGVQGTSPRVGDFTGLRGADPVEVLARVPADWLVRPSRKGGGVQFVDPANPRGDTWIRIMPGELNASHPSGRGPYLRVLENGGYRDASGRPQPNNKTPEGHIPLRGNPDL